MCTAHAGDPVFAATFFAELGPAGTCAFLGRLSGLGLSEYDPDSELGTQIGVPSPTSALPRQRARRHRTASTP
ncbi:MAG: hypothetical protein M3422_13140 [Actinomycetota bacterium]|nr:hypothetical protein [Actinomycetota bacterium]